MRKRKAFSIKERPNPSGLTMAERELCMNMMHSLHDSTQLEVERRNRYRQRAGLDPIDAIEQLEVRRDVERCAYRQLTGRTGGSGGPFTLNLTAGPRDADLEYVRRSLGL